MSDQHWLEIIKEFKRLGGAIYNLERREGPNGWGLFRTHASERAGIFVPESLLVDRSSIYLDDNGNALAKGLASESLETFFAHYQQALSWGSAKATEKIIYEGLRLISERAHSIVTLLHRGALSALEIEQVDKAILPYLYNIGAYVIKTVVILLRSGSWSIIHPNPISLRSETMALSAVLNPAIKLETKHFTDTMRVPRFHAR